MNSTTTTSTTHKPPFTVFTQTRVKDGRHETDDDSGSARKLRGNRTLTLVSDLLGCLQQAGGHPAVPAQPVSQVRPGHVHEPRIHTRKRRSFPVGGVHVHFQFKGDFPEDKK